MKNSILLPLVLGAVLVGCSRTQTESGKVSSSDQPDAKKPAYSEKAVAGSPSSTPAASSDPVSGEPKNAPGSASVATTPPPPVPTEPATLPTPIPSPTPATDATIPESVRVATTPPAVPMPSPTATSGAMKSNLSDRLTEWKLTADAIGNEFARTGRIERSKTIGAGEPTGPMDEVLVASINGKLQGDPSLSALKLDATVEKGVVTLAGTARSLDQIGRAVGVALDTEGVTKAISTIKLEPVAP